MVRNVTMVRYRAPMGHGHPTMDRQSTMVRRHARMDHRHTQLPMPPRQRDRRVMCSGDAAPGVADGGGSAIRRSMPDPTAAMDRRPAQAITARIDVANIGDPKAGNRSAGARCRRDPSRSGASRDNEVLAAPDRQHRDRLACLINARRHGFRVPILADPTWSAEVDTMASSPAPPHPNLSAIQSALCARQQ